MPPSDAPGPPRGDAPDGEALDPILTPGMTLGPYQVVERVGEGRIGPVFRIRHRAFRVNQLLKVLRRRDRQVELGLRVEVQAQQRLRHPNAVPFGAVIDNPSVFGLVIDPVDGPTLRAVLADASAMPAEDALSVFVQMLAGVHAAHRVGVLHLAIVPDAVRLVSLPERVIPRVCDFGLAGAVHALSETDSAAARYIAPELVDDPTAGSTASDVYSLGVLLYELLAGTPPYWRRAEAGGPDGLPKGMRPVAKALRNVPAEIPPALTRALQFDPEARFPDCEAFARALFGEDFVLYDDADELEAEQFDLRPEPTFPRRPREVAPAGDPPSQPLLADLLAGRSGESPAAEARVAERAAPTRDAGPPIIVGRTRSAGTTSGEVVIPEVSADAPTVAAVVKGFPALEPVRPDDVALIPDDGELTPLPGPAPQAAPRAASSPKASSPKAPAPKASAPRVGSAPSATDGVRPIVQERVAVGDAVRAAPADVVEELKKLEEPARPHYRSARLVFQFVVAPLVLVLGVLGLQAGWSGYQLGVARAEYGYASAIVDARLAEAFDDGERLIAQGAPPERLLAAIDAGRAAGTLRQRAKALTDLRGLLHREFVALPASELPEDQLERRHLSKSIEGILRGVDAELATVDKLAEAEEGLLAGVGDALGFADGRPFGQQVDAMRPSSRLLASLSESE